MINTHATEVITREFGKKGRIEGHGLFSLNTAEWAEHVHREDVTQGTHGMPPLNETAVLICLSFDYQILLLHIAGAYISTP